MNAAVEYWSRLYADADGDTGVGESVGTDLGSEVDDTAAPAQDSRLGRGFYYLEGAGSLGDGA